MLLCKNIKAAIDCSNIYCEGNCDKVLQTRIFLFKRTIVFIGVTILIDSIVQKYKPNKFYTRYYYNKNIMARSSHTKSSVSIDLFNLPLLPDTRKHTTMISEIPNNFFMPDGKNMQLSKVVNSWTFDRLTPNGNEGVGVKLDYLEHAYGTRYYVIDKVNGDIYAIHNESLELTEFKGRFKSF